MEDAIPTLVVVVDGGPAMRTLDDLSRFATSADAVPIACFARTQHLISISYIIFITVFFKKAQNFHITVYIAIKQIEYLLSLYDKGDISAVALDGAFRVLNPPTKKLKYLLQLYDKEHIGGRALNYALQVWHRRC